MKAAMIVVAARRSATAAILTLLLLTLIGGCSSGKDDVSGGIDLPSAVAEIGSRLELDEVQGVDVEPILEVWLMDRNVVFHVARNEEKVNMARTRAELAAINNAAILQLKPLLSFDQLQKFKEIVDEDWNDFRSEIRGENLNRQDPMGQGMGGQGVGGNTRGGM